MRRISVRTMCVPQTRSATPARRLSSVCIVVTRCRQNPQRGAEAQRRFSLACSVILLGVSASVCEAFFCYHQNPQRGAEAQRGSALACSVASLCVSASLCGLTLDRDRGKCCIDDVDRA